MSDSDDRKYSQKVLECLTELVRISQKSSSTLKEILKATQALAPQTIESIGHKFSAPTPIKKEK